MCSPPPEADALVCDEMHAAEASPEDGTVTMDGKVLRRDPVTEVSLSRRYLLA